MQAVPRHVARRRKIGVGRAMVRHVDSLTAREIRAMKSSGKTPKEIAEIYHVSLWAVYRTLKRTGTTHCTTAKLIGITKLIKQGEIPKKISSEIDVSLWSVYRASRLVLSSDARRV